MSLEAPGTWRLVWLADDDRWAMEVTVTSGMRLVDHGTLVGDAIMEISYGLAEASGECWLACMFARIDPATAVFSPAVTQEVMGNIAW